MEVRVESCNYVATSRGCDMVAGGPERAIVRLLGLWGARKAVESGPWHVDGRS